jgi:hypothetical protein
MNIVLVYTAESRKETPVTTTLSNMCATQEAKYVERCPARLLPGLAGADLIFQWIGMVEYILCYGGPAEHWGPLPATRLTSRKILIIEQNIKTRT